MTTKRRANYDDPRKISVFVDRVALEEMQAEATRQGRSLSWVAQRAWAIARVRMRATAAPWSGPAERPGSGSGGDGG